jgi:YidC/Oxa1 family membrane protein insertase
MPVVFTVICYNFSCALALYSTVNGLFTMGQQLVVNRVMDKTPFTAPTAATAAPTPAAPAYTTGKRVMKNVTPKKKKF